MDCDVSILITLCFLIPLKILLIIYVDDIIVTGDDKQGIDDLKRYLQNSFRTKDLGKLCYFLGIEVA